MTLKGKGLNLQVLAECSCYLIFGALLFYLTYSGRYLNYVTPRMKPYLYGLSALMLLWTVFEGRYLLTPQYRVKLARSSVLIIPILLLAIRPATPGGSSMIPDYGSFGISMAAENRGGRISESGNQAVLAEDAGNQAPRGDVGNRAVPQGGTENQTVPPKDGGNQEPVPNEENGLAADRWETLKTDMPSEEDTSAETEGNTDHTAAGKDNTSHNGLNGLDEETKTITIADEDYYTWMYELSSSYKKYEGYTVVIKGFVYQDPEVEKISDFALVRLSMWCCAADLSPIGFLVDCGGDLNFKADDWVIVKGTLEASADGQSLMLKAASVEAAEKPEEEYVYPYF